MFLKPANSDTENGIQKFKMSAEQFIYSGNWKRHCLKRTRITRPQGWIKLFFSFQNVLLLKNAFLSCWGSDPRPPNVNFLKKCIFFMCSYICSCQRLSVKGGGVTGLAIKVKRTQKLFFSHLEGEWSGLNDTVIKKNNLFGHP